jgi:hypothetical protein
VSKCLRVSRIGKLLRLGTHLVDNYDCSIGAQARLSPLKPLATAV